MKCRTKFFFVTVAVWFPFLLFVLAIDSIVLATALLDFEEKQKVEAVEWVERVERIEQLDLGHLFECPFWERNRSQ